MQLPTGELSPMAFLGGGVCRGRGRSPPPGASSGLARPSNAWIRSAMAGPNRGRTVLPPRHDEGDAFVAGGGEARCADFPGQPCVFASHHQHGVEDQQSQAACEAGPGHPGRRDVERRPGVPRALAALMRISDRLTSANTTSVMREVRSARWCRGSSSARSSTSAGGEHGGVRAACGSRYAPCQRRPADCPAARGRRARATT